MNFAEALDILRKGDGLGATEDKAVETIRSEISATDKLDLILTTLVNEMMHSRNPSFSYHILQAIVMSGNSGIEESFVLRQLFVTESLGSKSVSDGISICMSALLACTSVFGE